jgi:hypothetical protein
MMECDALDVLAKYVVYLATAPSYWYTLNSSYDDKFHLSHRLGLDEDDYQYLLVAVGLAYFKGSKFCILRDQWDYFRGHEYFIDTNDLSKHNRRSKQNSMPPSKSIFELDTKNMNINGDCKVWYVLRIGKMDDTSSLDFGSQKKYGEDPPRMTRILQVQQQAFLSSAANIIANTKISLVNLSEEPMVMGEEQADNTTNVSPITTMKEDADNTTTTTIAANSMTTATRTMTTTTMMMMAAVSHTSRPVSTKDDTTSATQFLTPFRMSNTAYCSTITPDSDTTITVPTLGQKYPALAAIFGNDFDPFQEDIQQKIQAYLTEITHILDASRAGLKVKDFGGHDVYYVRVPKTSSDKSFNNSRSWADDALKINGSPHQGTDESAFRVSNHLCRFYPGPFLAALANQGMAIAKPMTTVQFAAMLSALHITGQKEKVLARYLRHYLGKGFCPSLRGISILAAGHAEIFTDSVEWEYEEGERKEEWAEKNLHS